MLIKKASFRCGFDEKSPQFFSQLFQEIETKYFPGEVVDFKEREELIFTKNPRIPNEYCTYIDRPGKLKLSLRFNDGMKGRLEYLEVCNFRNSRPKALDLKALAGNWIRRVSKLTLLKGLLPGDDTTPTGRSRKPKPVVANGYTIIPTAGSKAVVAPDKPYLQVKKMEDAFFRFRQRERGVVLRDDGSLKIPMFHYETHEKISEQYIWRTADGKTEKRFLKGATTRDGVFLISGRSLQQALTSGKRVVLCEGYATALTAQLALPSAEICCCFSFHNTIRVLKSTVMANPHTKIHILMDIAKGALTPKPEDLLDVQAIRDINQNVQILVPERGAGDVDLDTDINDRYCRTGSLAVEDVSWLVDVFKRSSAWHRKRTKDGIRDINEFVYTVAPNFFKQFGILSEFRLFFAPMHLYILRKDGCIHTISKAEARGVPEYLPYGDKETWLLTYINSMRRKLTSLGLVFTVDGVRYLPGAPSVFKAEGKEFLNSWSPVYYEHPTDFNDVNNRKIFKSYVKTLLDHVEYLTPNKTSFLWLLRWIEEFVVNPLKHPTGTPVLINQYQGTGRGWLTATLCKMAGEVHSVESMPADQIFSKFNDYLATKYFVSVEEFAIFGRKKYDRVKEITTANRVWVNPKGAKEYSHQRTCRFFFTSNRPDCLEIDENDRRLSIMISNAKPREPEYYDKLYNILKDPLFIESLIHYFSNRAKYDPEFGIESGYDVNLYAPCDSEAVAHVAKQSKPDYTRDVLSKVPEHNYETRIAESIDDERNNYTRKTTCAEVPRLVSIQTRQVSSGATAKEVAKTQASMNKSNPIVWFDFEVESSVDITKRGVERYAADESTKTLMCAYAVGDEDVNLWLPGQPIPEVFNQESYAKYNYGAFNASFEYVLWKNAFGYAPPDPVKWVDPSAVAASLGFARSLAGLCKALGVDTDESKSVEGAELMKKICLKFRARYVIPTEEEILGLAEYCKQDVVAMRACWKKIRSEDRDTIKRERVPFTHTMAMMNTPVHVDVDLVNRLIMQRDAIIKSAQECIVKHAGDLNPRSSMQVLAFLKTYGIEETEFTIAVRKRLLSKTDLNPTVRVVLEAIDQVKSSSLVKLDRVLDMVDTNGCIYGLLQYFGAHTGRFAGRLLQVQNLPRSSGADVNGIDEIDEVEGLKGFLRNIIIPREGFEFYVVDYASIEARVLAFLAKETSVLNWFMTGVDVYCKVAEILTDKLVVTKGDPERVLGKVCTLGLGYGMGIDKFLQQLELAGVKKSKEEAAEIHKKWREANPSIVRYWRSCMNMFTKNLAPSKFIEGALETHIKLVSGRTIHYRDVRESEGKYGIEYNMLRPGRSPGVQGAFQKCYGGSLTENVVQAVSRDILIEAIYKLEKWFVSSKCKEEARIVFHVHDEIVFEIPKGCSDELTKGICRIMENPASWVPKGLMKVEGSKCDRYTK